MASDDENHPRPLPVVIPKTLSPQIEEDFVPKGKVWLVGSITLEAE